MARRRRLIVALVCVASLVAAHRPILRITASFLVVGGVVEREPRVRDVLLDSGDLRHDAVATLFREGALGSVLIRKAPSSRLEQLGVVQSLAEVDRTELVKRGVKPKQIVFFRNRSEEFLKEWLEERPTSVVEVYCDRFASRSLRTEIHQLISQKDQQRLRFRPLPDRRFDETNWWRSRTGIMAFSGNVFWLGFVLLSPRRLPDKPILTPDEYETLVISNGP